VMQEVEEVGVMGLPPTAPTVVLSVLASAC
jgi:hypothetical protein